MLNSVAPLTTKPRGRLIIHDDATIQSLAKIPEGLLSSNLVEEQSRPVAEEKDRIFHRLKFILKDHKRLKQATLEHIKILSTNEDTIARQKNEIEGLKSKLHSIVSKVKAQQAVISKLKSKKKKMEASNGVLINENKHYSEEIRQLQIKLEIEKESLAKQDNVQSKLSYAEAKLQKVENDYKDAIEENRKLKRINRKAERYLGNLSKGIANAAEDEKDNIELRRQLDKMRQLMLNTEESAKKRESELKDQIISLQREFLDASSTLLKNKTIISKMEENRLEANRRFHMEKQKLEDEYEKRLEENMSLRQPFIKVDAGTNTDAPAIELPSNASVNPVEEITEPQTKNLSNDEAFHNFQLGFISDIKETDTELSLEEGRRFHKETMLTFFTSNLNAVVKNLIDISKYTSVSDKSVKRFSEFIKITVESKFEALYKPVKQAFEERIALREQINKLRSEWENLMEERMSAVITKDALSSAMPIRSNSFSQSSCQVQTEVISLNSNETQTYEKQTREVGTQAYLSDGFQNAISKSSKAIDKRWSFLTEASGGLSMDGMDFPYADNHLCHLMLVLIQRK